jgi:hypothetical protein
VGERPRGDAQNSRCVPGCPGEQCPTTTASFRSGPRQLRRQRRQRQEWWSSSSSDRDSNPWVECPPRHSARRRTRPRAGSAPARRRPSGLVALRRVHRPSPRREFPTAVELQLAWQTRLRRRRRPRPEEARPGARSRLPFNGPRRRRNRGTGLRRRLWPEGAPSTFLLLGPSEVQAAVARRLFRLGERSSKEFRPPLIAPQRSLPRSSQEDHPQSPRDRLLARHPPRPRKLTEKKKKKKKKILPLSHCRRRPAPAPVLGRIPKRSWKR